MQRPVPSKNIQRKKYYYNTQPKTINYEKHIVGGFLTKHTLNFICTKKKIIHTSNIYDKNLLVAEI